MALGQQKSEFCQWTMQQPWNEKDDLLKVRYTCYDAAAGLVTVPPDELPVHPFAVD